jgi:hypothetical protein
MLLKAAYFRLAGWKISDPILLADLDNARKHANTVFGLGMSNLHDLPRWGQLLVEERVLRGVPFPILFARRLQARLKTIYLNWREHLRYRINKPYRGEVGRTYAATGWILGQYRHL